MISKTKVFLISLILLASCVTKSYEDLRSQNRFNISKIKIGNSLSEVVKIMGIEKADGDISGYQGEVVMNPYKTENLTHSGKPYLIYYYYTEKIGDKSWETGVTPIIFVNEKVIGIGWRSMENLGLESASKTFKVR